MRNCVNLGAIPGIIYEYFFARKVQWSRTLSSRSSLDPCIGYTQEELRSDRGKGSTALLIMQRIIALANKPMLRF